MEVLDNRNKTAKSDGKFKELVKKIRKIKNIEVITGVFILAIILLVYAYGFNKNQTPSGEQTAYSYLDDEKKLEDILSKIEGAGQVKVMITYNGTARQVAAESTDVTTSTKTDDSGGSSYTTTNRSESSNPVYSGGQAMVVQELNPEIIGVAIVAEGAKDLTVRIELMRVAATALNVNQSLITVSAGVFA